VSLRLSLKPRDTAQPAAIPRTIGCVPVSPKRLNEQVRRNANRLHAAALSYRERQAGGDSLCAGCKHSHLYRRRGKPEASVYCHRLDRNVPPDIAECSEFEPVAAPTLGQMREIALPIDPRPGIRDGSYR
jgi:hypothetical protein